MRRQHGCEGFELEINFVVGSCIRGCVVEDGVDVFEGLVSALFGFVFIAAGGAHAGPVEDYAGVADEGHVFVGPAIGLEDRGASGYGASGWEDPEGEDAVGTGSGDDC